MKIDRTLKKLLLSTLRSKHGMELELLELENKIDATKKEHEAIEQETEEIKAQTERLKSNLEQYTNEIYAPHEVEMSLFSLVVEDQLCNMEEKRRHREVELCEISVRADMAIERTTALNNEREHLLTQIATLNNDEEKEDEESTALSLQLKATVAKVRIS